MGVETDSLEVVFLDAAGTLFEVRGSVGEIYSSVAQRYGVDSSPREIERTFTAIFRRRSLESVWPGSEEDRLAREKRWWFELVQEVFADMMPAVTLEMFFEEVFEIFRTERSWRLYPDTLPSLEKLRAAGYRLGIISNFDSRLRDLLVALGIGSVFEHVAISWEVGVAKPDPKIYRSALDAMNISATEAVHIGDSIRDDYIGATEAGLQAILLDRLGVYWGPEPRILSLSELCEILP